MFGGGWLLLLEGGGREGRAEGAARKTSVPIVEAQVQVWSWELYEIRGLEVWRSRIWMRVVGSGCGGCCGAGVLVRVVGELGERLPSRSGSSTRRAGLMAQVSWLDACFCWFCLVGELSRSLSAESSSSSCSWSSCCCCSAGAELASFGGVLGFFGALVWWELDEQSMVT